MTLSAGSLKAGTTALYCRFGSDGAAAAAAVAFSSAGAAVQFVAPAGVANTKVGRCRLKPVFASTG